MEELVMESGPLDPLSIEQDGVNGAGEAIALATSQSLLVRIVTFGCEFAMMVGGVVPYVPQYIAIYRNIPLYSAIYRTIPQYIKIFSVESA